MYRYLVVAVIFLVLFLGAFDRANVSLLLVDPGFLRDMGLEGSPEKQGLVMTLLLLPYALSNIFLSFSADRWGARRVLALMTGLWAVVGLFLGAAASFPALLAGRAARGIAEGPMFPIANRFVRNWFPPQERGMANAIWTNGQRAGLGLSVPLLAFAISTMGWRFSFFLQAGLIALLAVPAVWFLTADRPEVTARVSEKERALILSGRRGGTERSGESESKAQVGLLLRNSDFWLAVIYHLAILGVYSGLVTWLPKYLKEDRGFDLGQMVLFTMLPHFFSVGSSLFFGYLSDRTGHRASICTIGVAGTSLLICLAAFAPNPVLSAALIAFGFGGWAAGVPPYYAIMQKIVPGRIMATGIGIDNGLSNFGSALAPLAVGLLIGATGAYLGGLLFLVGVGVCGAVAAGILVSRGY